MRIELDWEKVVGSVLAALITQLGKDPIPYLKKIFVFIAAGVFLVISRPWVWMRHASELVVIMPTAPLPNRPLLKS